MAGSLPQSIEVWLRAHGHDVERYGALVAGAGGDEAWTSVGSAVGEAVARGNADYGVLCCWTGTGVSIAANKVAGRSGRALRRSADGGGCARMERCQRALHEPARRLTVAEEILDAWFTAAPTTQPAFRAMIDGYATGR